MKLCLYLCQTSFNNELTLRNGFTLIFTNMQGSSGTPKIRKYTSYLSPPNAMRALTDLLQTRTRTRTSSAVPLLTRRH